MVYISDDPGIQFIQVALSATRVPDSLCEFVVNDRRYLTGMGFATFLLRPEFAPYLDTAEATNEAVQNNQVRSGGHVADAILVARTLGRIRAGETDVHGILTPYVRRPELGTIAVSTLRHLTAFPDDQAAAALIDGYFTHPDTQVRLSIGRTAYFNVVAPWARRALVSLEEAVASRSANLADVRRLVRDLILTFQNNPDFNMVEYVSTIKDPGMLVAVLNGLPKDAGGPYADVHTGAFVTRVVLPALTGDLSGRVAPSEVASLAELVHVNWTYEACATVHAAAQQSLNTPKKARHKLAQALIELIAERVDIGAGGASPAAPGATLASVLPDPPAGLGDWVVAQFPDVSPAGWQVAADLARKLSKSERLERVVTTAAETLA